MSELEGELERRTLTYTSWNLSATKMETKGWHPTLFTYANSGPEKINEIKVIQWLYCPVAFFSVFALDFSLLSWHVLILITPQAINHVYYDTEYRTEWCRCNSTSVPCFLFARKFSQGAALRLLGDGVVSQFGAAASLDPPPWSTMFLHLSH